MSYFELLTFTILGTIGMLATVVLVAGLCRLALFLVMIKPGYCNLPVSKAHIKGKKQ